GRRVERLKRFGISIEQAKSVRSLLLDVPALLGELKHIVEHIRNRSGDVEDSQRARGMYFKLLLPRFDQPSHHAVRYQIRLREEVRNPLFDRLLAECRESRLCMSVCRITADHLTNGVAKIRRLRRRIITQRVKMDVSVSEEVRRERLQREAANPAIGTRVEALRRFLCERVTRVEQFHISAVRTDAHGCAPRRRANTSRARRMQRWSSLRA